MLHAPAIKDTHHGLPNDTGTPPSNSQRLRLWCSEPTINTVVLRLYFIPYRSPSFHTTYRPIRWYAGNWQFHGWGLVDPDTQTKDTNGRRQTEIIPATRYHDSTSERLQLYPQAHHDLHISDKGPSPQIKLTTREPHPRTANVYISDARNILM